jgi:hypothetical protein
MERTTKFPTSFGITRVCQGRSELEDRKIFEAGLRKYLRPTNERKQMSIKTLRKRIALVAVSALTAGVFSVVSAPVANAALIEYAAGTDGALGALAGTYCAGIGSTGVAGKTQTDSTAADDLRTIYMPLAGNVKLAVADAGDRIEVSGSLVIEGTAAAVVVSNGGKTGVATANEDVATIRAGATGTFSLKSYSTSTSTTALSSITIIVVATCAADAWSDSTSLYETSTAEDAAPGGEAGSVYTFVDEDTAFVSLVGKNAYGSVLAQGTWIVSATNGALVGISSAGTTAVGATSIASATADGTNIYAAIEQATSGTALNTVVTISYNGTTVYSKAIKFTGDAAKITVFGVDVQDPANTAAGDYDVTVQDAAGNYLAWVVAGDSSKYNSIVTSVTGGTTPANATGTVAAATWTCNGVSGEATVRVKATTNAATTIYSNDFVAKCGSTPYTYTASLDKASYIPGDIATLTITAKDASGFAPQKGSTIDSAGGVPSIAGSQLTAVNTPVAADTFNASGVKTYTFTVGSTAGKYNMAVNLGYTGNAAVAVGYSVASTGDVSNAEVLKSIVALIASINKQIQALQKLILRR